MSSVQYDDSGSSSQADDNSLDDQQFLSALIGSLPVLVGFIIFFNVVRKRHKYYSANFLHHSSRAPRGLPDPRQKSFTELMGYLWSLTDDEIVRFLGVDGFAYVRLLWMMVEVAAIIFPIGLFILVPIYSTGNHSTNHQMLPQFTIGNVQPGNWRLWIIVGASCLTMNIACARIGVCFSTIAKYVDSEWHTRDSDAAYVVMISNIPSDYDSEESLEQFLRELFGDDLDHVIFTQDVEKMWLDYEKYLSLQNKLAAVKDLEATHCCWRQENEETIKLHLELVKEQLRRYQFSDFKQFPVAFVFFKTMKSTVLCSSTSLLPHVKHMKVEQAPDEHDIVWSNMGIPPQQRQTASILVAISYTLLIMYYTPLMIAIQALANLDAMAEKYPSFEKFLEYNETMRTLLTGLVPIVIYSSFFLVLPYLLHYLAGIMNYDTRSARDSSTLRKHTDCLIGMGLLVTFMASGIFQDVKEINDPNTWFDTLGENMPRNSTFFINVMCWAGLLGIGLELAQLPSFFKDCIGLWLHQDFDFYIYMPNMLFYFAIMMTYIPIAPLILIPSISFFTAGYFVYLHQLLFVYKIPYKVGAKSFPELYSRLYWGVWISQFVLVGFFILKHGYYQGPIMLILMYWTFITQNQQVDEWLPLFQNASLYSAKVQDGVRGPRKFKKAAYEPPCKHWDSRFKQSLDYVRMEEAEFPSLLPDPLNGDSVYSNGDIEDL